MKRKGIIKKADAKDAIEKQGAFLHDNGSPIAHFYVVWGNWESWQTIRYDTFYALKYEMKLVESRDGKCTNWRLPEKKP